MIRQDHRPAPRGPGAGDRAVVAAAGPAGRIPSIDALRGLAIALMVPANAAGDLLAGPHPGALRLVGSFAAPIFVMLAGMMIGIAAGRGRSDPRRGLCRAFGRGALLVLIGAALDAGAGLWPFLTCDVLYLIGLSLPICSLAAGASPAAGWALPGLVLLATPWSQAGLGYRAVIDTPTLDGSGPAWPAPAWDVALRYLVDGWFPVFPWLGLALLGVPLGRLRARRGSFAGAGIAGAALAAAGGIVWWAGPGELATRCGYSELFYRPTPGFLVAAIGVLLGLARGLERPAGLVLGRPLEPLGRCALLLYVVHLLAIRALASSIGEELTIGRFLALVAALLAGLLLLALIVDAAKRRLRERGVRLPGMARTLLGT
jgi:uncharacterized membrane protein